MKKLSAVILATAAVCSFAIAKDHTHTVTTLTNEHGQPKLSKTDTVPSKKKSKRSTIRRDTPNTTNKAPAMYPNNPGNTTNPNLNRPGTPVVTPSTPPATMPTPNTPPQNSPTTPPAYPPATTPTPTTPPSAPPQPTTTPPHI